MEELFMAKSTLVENSLKSKLKNLIRNPSLLALIIFVLFSLILFSVYPLYSIFKAIFISEGQLNLKVIKKAIEKPRIYQTIWNSIKLGVTSAVISTIIGFIFAYSVTRPRMFGRKIFNFIAIFPVVSPPFVLALS